MVSLLLPEICLAHGIIDHNLAWWQQWNWSLPVLLSLAAVTLFYFLGWKRMRTRLGAEHQAKNWQGAAFLLGLFFIVLSLISPLDPLSDALAWIHMLQHTILMMIAAPLFALASPKHLSQWSIPAPIWRRYWLLGKLFSHMGLGWLARPLGIWLLYSITLWIWHLPKLYEAALHVEWIHDLQHLSFFLTSYFFWKLLLDPFGENPLRPEAGLLYLFVTSIHSMILGVLMALSPVVWYQPYIETAPLYGFSPLEDQQVAGLIMWMPAGITYLIVAIFLLHRTLGSAAFKR